MAPALMRDSKVRLFTTLSSRRFRKSPRLLKGPPRSRSSRMAKAAPSPTFFTAESPKRISSPTTLKSKPERLMSGGRTSMPMARASRMYSATLSESCRSTERRAAMNSTG